VCHPDSGDGYPDCYRRITVYKEIPGILKAEQKFPYGVEKIMDRNWAFQELVALSEELGLYDELLYS
jgi:hypothetical protein